MQDLLNEYPKAIATLLIGVAVTYLTGKIPEAFLNPGIVSAAQTIVGGGAAILFGRFIRLTKGEAEVVKNIEKEESKDQLK